MILGVGQPRTDLEIGQGRKQRATTVVLALSSPHREVSGDTVYGLDLIA